jgi:hypothetical protein
MTNRARLIALAIAFAAGVALGAWIVQPDPLPDGDMHVQDEDQRYTLRDWQRDRDDITGFDLLQRFQAPDTADTQTECFQVPSWITRQTSRPTRADSATQSRPGEAVATPLPASRPGAKLPGATRYTTSDTTLSQGRWIGVPLYETKPALSLTRDRAVLVGFDPADGRTLRYTYRLPEPSRFHVSLGIGARIPLGGADPTPIVPLRLRRDLVRTRIGGVDVALSPEIEGGLPVLGAEPYIQPAAHLTFSW